MSIVLTAYPTVLPTGPTAHAVCYELVGGCSPSALRGYAAILGMCVPGLWAPAEKGGAGLVALFTYKSCGNDVAEFGARCWGVLHAAGVTERAIIAAADPIFAMIHARTFPTIEETAERVGFTGASEGA